MNETITLYEALANLAIDPASLGLTVTEQKGFDYGSPDIRFNALKDPVITTIGADVSKQMFYRSINDTLSALGLTGNEPVIQFIMTMIAVAKNPPT